MKKTQIVYSLIATDRNTYLEEMWASLYSLRLYEPDREVRVVCDEATEPYMRRFPELMKMITEVVAVALPADYDSKLRSRELKTTVRRHVKGPYLFVDNDTIICGKLDYIDTLTCSVAAVREFNMTLRENPYGQGVIDTQQHVFGNAITEDEPYFNSGVMYVADDDTARCLCEAWNSNWHHSTFQKGNSQDQPALLKSNHDLGNIIKELPGEYNCQPCMSLRHLHEAHIIHYLHTHFPKDLSFSPFMDKAVYRQIKADGGISEETAHLIAHCRSAYAAPSCAVGWKQMYFMASPVFEPLAQINQDGGPASWLMFKVTNWLWWLHKRIPHGSHRLSRKNLKSV